MHVWKITTKNSKKIKKLELTMSLIFYEKFPFVFKCYVIRSSYSITVSPQSVSITCRHCHFLMLTFELPPYVFQYLILPWRFEYNTGRCNQPDFPVFAPLAVIPIYGLFFGFYFNFLCSIANFRQENEKEVKRTFVVFKFRGNYPAQ